MLNRDRPSVVGQALKSIFALVASGSFYPALPLQVHGVSEIQQAFRSLQSGHVEDGDALINGGSQRLHVADITGRCLNSRALGCQLANEVTGRLALSTRSRQKNEVSCSPADQPSSYTLSKSSKASCNHVRRVRLHRAAQLWTQYSLNRIIRSELYHHFTSGLTPIKGCIQAAMVLHDAPFETMTYEVWQKAISPKVSRSFNLHTTLPKGMDFFVMLSSMAGVCGSCGQANYAAGNTYEDSLARHCIASGERATALDLGPFADMGWVAARTELQKLYTELSDSPVTEAELQALLEYFGGLSNEDPQKRFPEPQYTILRVARTSRMAVYLDKPMFRSLAVSSQSAKDGNAEPDDIKKKVATSSSDTPSPANFDVREAFAHAETLTAAAMTVKEAFAHKVAETLGLSREELDTEVPVHRYGVDS